MILNELLALTLIPSLMNGNENGTLKSASPQNSTVPTLEDHFFRDTFFHPRESNQSSVRSGGESIIIPIIGNLNGNLTNRNRIAHVRNDRLLAEILDEELELNLAFPDDYFDHLQDKSEEVRELIRSRQRAIRSEHRQSRSNFDESSTEFPILTPTIDLTTNSPMTSTTTSVSTSKPKPGQGVIGSTISQVNQGAHSLIETISKPFAGVKNLFGKKKQTTTSTVAPQTLVPEPMSVPTTVLDCKPVQTEYNGECYNVLQELPCKEGEWLVEDEITGKGKCVQNACAHKQGTAMFGGDCIIVSTDKPCHSGMKTIIYKSGKVECDCKEGYLYNEQDASCYKAYRQGPCPQFQFFANSKKSEAGGGKPNCMPNLCLTDGLFCNAPRCPRQRNCVQLDSPCGAAGSFSVHPLANTPLCQEPDQQVNPDKIIGNVPTLSCAPGTRRDILGNCRTPTDITFS